MEAAFISKVLATRVCNDPRVETCARKTKETRTHALKCAQTDTCEPINMQILTRSHAQHARTAIVRRTNAEKHI